jgi:hypothetical protein
MLPRMLAAFVLFVTLVVFAGGAAAAPKKEVTAADRKAAHALFTEGRKAFGIGDYRQAGQKFEAAYARAPHHDALWNAARAWHKAGDWTRAANLYEKYLQTAPADAADRNSALAAQREISPKVARLEVQSSDEIGSITVDAQPLEGKTIYVTPGSHVVEGKLTKAPDEGEAVRVTQVVAGGDSVSVALARPAPPPPAPAPVVMMTPAPATTTTSPPAEPEHRKGISPVFFIVGAVATAAVGGVAIWSGLDTVHRKDDYLKSLTQSQLDDGKAAQTRTNILIGVTAGLGALTFGTLFFTNWKGGSKEQVAIGIGPGAVSASGRF